MSLLSEVRKCSFDLIFIRETFSSEIIHEINRELEYEKDNLKYKDPYAELVKYTKDFISEKKLKEEVNKLYGSTFEEKAEKYLLGLIKVKLDSIYKAKKSNMELKDYQRKAVDFIANHRGMIAAFEMGSGKTLTAVAIINCMINMTKYLGIFNFRAIIVTSPTLQSNFIKEMRAYGINPELVLEDYLDFVTYRQLLTKIKNDNSYCDNSLVIIDEAHNARTDYNKNFSLVSKKKDESVETITKQAAATVACSSSAMKVLLLTGTPFYNSTIDIINLAAMVKGDDTPSKIDPYALMKENYQEFKEYYQNIFLFHKNDQAHFPRRTDVIYNIVMDSVVLKKYEQIENIAEHDIDKGIVTKKGRGRPADVEIDQDELAETTKKDGRGRNAYMAPVRTAVNNLEPCLKCKYLVRIVKAVVKDTDTPEKVLIFSDFKGTGSSLIRDKLKKVGIDSIVMDGDVKVEERPFLVKDFNAGIKNVLILTRTGGEGLDLKNVRHVISFEKGWNIAGMEQYIGRAIRYNSHASLPYDQRTVKVWHLMLIKPSDYRNMPANVLNYAPNEFHNLDGNENLPVKDPETKSVDLYLFCKAIEKQKTMDELRKELEKIQIGSPGVDE